jgi:RNA polymerase sigma factor (sigma-70 family)
MATAPLGAMLRHIRNLAADQMMSAQTDGALLRAFLSGNNQPAFEALMRRHGPMVLRVCLRTLGHVHDAEDAFQATFLVLARKANSIRRRESLASWLHGVAYRMATHANRAAARRHQHESQAKPTPPRDPVLSAAWHELQVLLDEEIERLPETLRAPFVYCCLENKSCADAGRQLGLEEGTVWKRLSRARKLLRQRLALRGVSLATVLAGAAVAANDALAAVPPSLVVSTAKAATLIAAGQVASVGVISSKVAALTEGVLRVMFITKLKTTAVVLLAVVVAGTGTGVLTYRTPAAEQPGSAPEASTSSAPASKGLTPSDAAKIAKLIDQLGSDSFDDRDKATKELGEIGAPALDALRKAAQGTDAERKKRAEDLIEKIEARDEEARVLAPRRVQLVYKDTPLAEAVADFKKQCGYDLTLSDPKAKLKDRTISLNTGEITFWQALDQFCRKADLVDTAPAPAATASGGDGPPPGGAGTDDPLTKDLNEEARPAGGGAGRGGVILTDGKPLTLPTDDRTSVRVRALNNADRVGAPAKGEILLPLEITPEPKLRWQQFVAVHITKATDDQGQNLEQVVAGDADHILPSAAGQMGDNPLPPPKEGVLIVANAGQNTAISLGVRLKTGAKAATSLKEISGTITVRVLEEGKPVSKSVTVKVPFTLKSVPLP